ncbi:MAG: hypothetical protein VB048_07620 [Bacteroidaceae bacterium]|nr:hypothetical protein [Bacteroidaceae bacterium]MEA5017691.1 hypothetical protein [Erysipelotrichaceae bacterium]
MKKICIVGYNFGEKYQSFIPIYIYSILKNYPDYSVIIFSDIELNTRTKEMIELINNLGDFEIVENYRFGLEEGRKINNILSHKQAIRWFFYDEKFSKYETIYIGDIDIFICKEAGGIYNQHMIHCDKIGLPYSNYIRLTTDCDKLTFKMILYYLKTKQYDRLLKKLKGVAITENRLTGLHFLKTHEYFDNVKQYFPDFINEITSRSTRIIRNDEAMLYELVVKSGIGLPPVSPNSPSLEYMQPESIAFRPHHGIHLGIFRNRKTTLKQRQVLDSYIYHGYFRQYIELKNTDVVLRNLIDNSDIFVRNLFKRVEDYYLK